MRLWRSVLAALMGWLAGYLASSPAMMMTGWRDSERDPKVFATIIGFGLLAWGAWTLLLAVGAWLLFALPAALFIPPAFLVRHRHAVLAITILATVGAVAQKMRSFQDLAASHVALRFVLYMPYGAFACFFGVVTAWWYIRGLRRSALD